MKYDAVLFDLGNTLVSYYTRQEWPAVLDEALHDASACLRELNHTWDEPGVPQRVLAERGERKDCVVVPLIERLSRVFQIPPGRLTPAEQMTLCRAFMRKTFEMALLYDDALPTLAALHKRGLRTGILSNSPWGSPPELWREELVRHGLLKAVDAAVFCTEVGKRKPHRRAFWHVIKLLRTRPDRCLFVGDDPRWDIAGPTGMGMDAVLIARNGSAEPCDAPTIRTLQELMEIIK